MEEFAKILDKKTTAAEQIIYSYLPKEVGKQSRVMEAMNYSVKAGGKRLRPILMQETALLFGYSGDDIKPFMTALEMIHTYSLVHDDLPAMDNDDIRRGQPTTHKKFGHAMGILAGDGLLNYAYEVCAGAIAESSYTDRAVRAFKLLSEKSGIYGMIGGQTVDVLLTGKPVDKDTLDFIYRLKTGALIEAAMMIGAVLAGASDNETEAVRKIALGTGMAFQIQDDILDVESTTKELGKPVLSDEKNEKTTYVTLFGIDNAKEKVREYTNQALELFDGLGRANDFLRELLIKLVSRKK